MWVTLSLMITQALPAISEWRLKKPSHDLIWKHDTRNERLCLHYAAPLPLRPTRCISSLTHDLLRSEHQIIIELGSAVHQHAILRQHVERDIIVCC